MTAPSSSDDSPLVPEGRYEMVYLDHSVWTFMGKQPKVTIRFQIMEPGDYFETVISAYYPVKSYFSKQRVRVSKRSDLYRDYCRVFPDQPAPRPDRIPLTNLAGVLVFGNVLIVAKGYDQREIPKNARYSRVKSIERWGAK